MIIPNTRSLDNSTCIHAGEYGQRFRKENVARRCSCSHRACTILWVFQVLKDDGKKTGSELVLPDFFHLNGAKSLWLGWCASLVNLPETISSHLKINGWKMTCPLGMAYFHGRWLLVFREDYKSDLYSSKWWSVATSITWGSRICFFCVKGLSFKALYGFCLSKLIPNQKPFVYDLDFWKSIAKWLKSIKPYWEVKSVKFLPHKNKNVFVKYTPRNISMDFTY